MNAPDLIGQMDRLIEQQERELRKLKEARVALAGKRRYRRHSNPTKAGRGARQKVSTR
jgi:hypothetical protein